MKNLIAISGKINSGKDTVGKIIQILVSFPKMTTEKVIENLDKEWYNNIYEIKKIAGKLKEVVAIIIGCRVEQLEDREFKETPLGEEWKLYRTTSSYGAPDDISVNKMGWTHEQEEILTPRKILQLMGTEAGREIIHPNIWVNSFLADWKPDYIGSNYSDFYHASRMIEGQYKFWKENPDRRGTETPVFAKEIYPNWIITDLRFPNEYDAVKERDGLLIRVNRPSGKYIGDDHPSETSLDSHKFDYVIDNNGSLSNLIGKVQAILELEKII